MRITQVVGAASLLLALPLPALAADGHSHALAHLDYLHKKHAHRRKPSPSSSVAELSLSAVHEHLLPLVRPAHDDAQKQIRKRATCAFPTNAGLVAVTPGSQNAGWAMSPDQVCAAGDFCPYACPPGQVSMQWDPSVKAYSYPGSMNGGLKCGSDGTVSKPIPANPYCAPGTGSVSVVNNLGEIHAVCQTVLPGNEAMLIPTSVQSSATLAVPGTSYWLSTAAHYYHNGPGVTTAEGCIWGDGSSPIGNWAPYVSGANTDASGNTFVKIGWNPIYTTAFPNVLPKWGIKIVCPGGGCNGMPCSIDPSTNSFNGVTSSTGSTGAGGANFCVVTVASGSSAQIEVFVAGQANVVHSSPASAAPVQAVPVLFAAPVAQNQAPPSSTSTTSTSTSSTTSTSTTPTSTLIPTTPSTSSSIATPATSQTILLTVAPHIFIETSNTTTDSSTIMSTILVSQFTASFAAASVQVSVGTVVPSSAQNPAAQSTAVSTPSSGAVRLGSLPLVALMCLAGALVL